MSERRTLPKWNPENSDGCSALALGSRRQRQRVNGWFFRKNDAAKAACVVHDEAYYYGGSKRHRQDADKALAAGWKDAGVSIIVRGLGRAAIRAFGGPGAKTPDVSWAFGGEFFQYSDQPAIPEPETSELDASSPLTSEPT